MNWYYVDAGQQTGPVDESQLQELLRLGKIQNDTLVWHEGMANWQPYYGVQPPAGIALPAPEPSLRPIAANEAACSECGKIFAKQDMLAYGGIHVCAGCKPIFMQKLAEGARIQTGRLNYAGFWIRFGAKLLDGLILGVIFIPPMLYFAFKNIGAKPQPQFQILQAAFQFGYIFANLGYSIFFLGRYGATPGKMACKLQVVTAEGGRVSFGRATGRGFAEMLSGIICDLGYLIAAFDGQKRALHDHICNTRVVYK